MITKFFLVGLILLSLTRMSVESHLKCRSPTEIFLIKNSRIECVSVPINVTKNYVSSNGRSSIGALSGLVFSCDNNLWEMTFIKNYHNFNNFLQGNSSIYVTPEFTSQKSEEIEGVKVLTCLKELNYSLQKTNYNKAIVLHYLQNDTVDVPFRQFIFVRKCCPHHAVFDTRTKACVTGLNVLEKLKLFLLNGSDDTRLAVSTGPPECAEPMIDYEIDANDVSLRNITFSVSKVAYTQVMVPRLSNDSITIKKKFLVSKHNGCFEMVQDSKSNQTLIARICRDPKFCDVNACIRKCCAKNTFPYIIDSSIVCKEADKFYTNLSINFHKAFANALNQTTLSSFDMNKDYGVLIGRLDRCLQSRIVISPGEFEWFLTSKGYVYVKNVIYNTNLYYSVYNQKKYCIDAIYQSEANFDYVFYLFICTNSEITVQIRYDETILILRWPNLIIISCVCLLLTLLVYACLPSLQNLHGKSLMCYLISLLLTYIGILGFAFNGVIQEETITSRTLDYMMIFFTRSAFSWLNVICFDVWRTFRVLRNNTIEEVRMHNKKFMLYCLYAWGFNFLMLIFAIVVDNTNVLPSYLQININLYRPVVRTRYGSLIHFEGPISIMIISNIVFFILTSRYYNKVKSEIKMANTDPTNPRSKRFYFERERVVMNIKLFIVMGIPWIWETVTTSILYLDLYFDYWIVNILDDIFDVFNSLQGLTIFVIFVLKGSVYEELRRRLGLKRN